MNESNCCARAEGTDGQTAMSNLLNDVEKKCRECKPLSPMVCVSSCKTWKLKNQLRSIKVRIEEPGFVVQLLNTLKNKSRLRILDSISKQSCSLAFLQQKLKSLGLNHSQRTIVEEYIKPLVSVGLADQAHNPYEATVLGRKINSMLKDFQDLDNILPPHSECYEEMTLEALLRNPLTYEDLRSIIPSKSVARVLSRLQKKGLAYTGEEKNYIFFFRTKRSVELSPLSPTEKRVHDSLPIEGISAGRLSEKTGISLRRTYKYLRKLKGKKLVFVRTKPISYALTPKGLKLAETLRNMQRTTSETQNTAQQLIRSNRQEEISIPLPEI